MASTAPSTALPKLNTAPTADPLVEQAMGNKINEDAPISSGSHPPVTAEDGKTTHETNIFEQKWDQAFGTEEKAKELGGAGVGRHPVSG